jgi:hypothetical protein
MQSADDDIRPIPLENSVRDTERANTSQVGNRFTTAEMLRLQGDKAVSRYKEGESIRIWAELPDFDHPRTIELLKFETRGKQRITYLSGFGASSGEGHWNTVSFKARQNKIGKWLLEPAVQLPPGEYCFTLRSLMDHYWFGVDKK